MTNPGALALSYRRLVKAVRPLRLLKSKKKTGGQHACYKDRLESLANMLTSASAALRKNDLFLSTLAISKQLFFLFVSGNRLTLHVGEGDIVGEC